MGGSNIYSITTEPCTLRVDPMNIGINGLIVLAGSIAIVPVCYDLFKGREALETAMFENPTQRKEIIFLSFLSFELAWLLTHLSV